MIMQHITQLPYLSEWMRMVSRGSYDHLQTYMDQQAWLRWLPLGYSYHSPKVPIFLIYALKNGHEMNKEAWKRWLLGGEHVLYPNILILLSHSWYIISRSYE